MLQHFLLLLGRMGDYTGQMTGKALALYCPMQICPDEIICPGPDFLVEVVTVCGQNMDKCHIHASYLSISLCLLERLLINTPTRLMIRVCCIVRQMVFSDMTGT